MRIHPSVKQNDNSDSEGVKSDLERSQISEVEEDQPVESTIFQLLLLKVKDILKKKSDLVENAKKGVPLTLLRPISIPN